MLIRLSPIDWKAEKEVIYAISDTNLKRALTKFMLAKEAILKVSKLKPVKLNNRNIVKAHVNMQTKLGRVQFIKRGEDIVMIPAFQW